MSDNTFGYSNGGLSQSLNGITSITDGSGASITDGNAIFIDTTTNTATINNNLTIPLSSLITLYGNIFLPAYNQYLTLTTLSYLDATSSIQSQFDNINTSFNAYISWFEIILGFPPNDTYINMIENIRMTKKLTINSGITLESTGINYTLTNQILSYVDPTSSIQSQFNNITTNYLTKVLAASTYLTQTNAASTYATQTALNNYTPTKATVSANATTGTFYLVLTNNNAGGASNLSIGLPSYDATNKIFKGMNNIDTGASTNATIYNSITTGSITIGGGLTTGNIKLGVSTQTGINQINGPTTFTGNTTFNNTITGTTTNTLSVKTSDITSGVYRVVLTEAGYPSSLSASLMTDSEGLNFDADNKILYSNTFHGDLDGVATTANNIKVDEDITSTTLYLPLITTSINTPSTGVKVNSLLRYNTVSNALTTTTFIGNLTGNCTGSSSSCTGNSARSTNVAFTLDNASVSLCVALTTATATTTSAALRLDTNLRFNASTNALTTTSFIGNLVGNVNGNLNGNILGNSNLDYTIHPSNASNISIGNPNGDGLINVYGEQIQLAGQLVTRRDIVMQSEAYCPFNIKTIFSTATLQSPFSKYIVCNFSIAGFIYMPYPEFAHYGMEIIVRNVGSAAAIVSNSTGNNVFLNLSNTPTSTLSGLVAISMVCIIHPSGVGYIWAQI